MYGACSSGRGLSAGMDLKQKLLTIFRKLDGHFGALHWWPGETPLEIIVGAILTQNTSWGNVEKAICNIKTADSLSTGRLFRIEKKKLAELIRPCGYYNLKAARLKEFIGFLHLEYGGDLDRMFRERTPALREKLLRVKGIGPETADSILLYAGGRPEFVVDAYTRRILERHRVIPEGLDYEEIKGIFMEHLPKSAGMFNQYHALLVNAGKHYCRKIPRCEGCPLHGL